MDGYLVEAAINPRVERPLEPPEFSILQLELDENEVSRWLKSRGYVVFRKPNRTTRSEFNSQLRKWRKKQRETRSISFKRAKRFISKPRLLGRRDAREGRKMNTRLFLPDLGKQQAYNDGFIEFMIFES